MDNALLSAAEQWLLSEEYAAEEGTLPHSKETKYAGAYRRMLAADYKFLTTTDPVAQRAIRFRAAERLFEAAQRDPIADFAQLSKTLFTTAMIVMLASPVALTVVLVLWPRARNLPGRALLLLLAMPFAIGLVLLGLPSYLALLRFGVASPSVLFFAGFSFTFLSFLLRELGGRHKPDRLATALGWLGRLGWLCVGAGAAWLVVDMFW